MNYSDSKTSSLASLMLLLARLEVSADGTVAHKSDLKKIRKAARAANARLSRMVGAVSNVLHYAQHATSPDESLLWVTTTLGENIDAVARLIELVKAVEQSGQWPATNEGCQIDLLGCFISLPHARSRHHPDALGAMPENVQMVEFAEATTTAHLDLEVVNLKRFTQALYDAHESGEAEGSMASAIGFVIEWTALVEILLEVSEDTSYHLKESLKTAA